MKLKKIIVAGCLLTGLTCFPIFADEAYSKSVESKKGTTYSIEYNYPPRPGTIKVYIQMGDRWISYDYENVKEIYSITSKGYEVKLKDGTSFAFLGNVTIKVGPDIIIR